MQKYPVTWTSKLNSPNLRISSRVALGAGFAFSTLCGSAVLAANTVGLNQCRNTLQAKRNDVPLVPTPHLRNLADKVKTDLQLSKSQAASVQIFCSNMESSDVFGSMNTTFGALIGVPIYLCAEKCDEVDFNQRLEGPLTEEEKEAVQAKFKESSVLTDNAKCYIFAEGIELCRNSTHFMIPACTAFFGTAMATSLTAAFIRKFDLHRYNFLQRNGLYMFTCVFFGFIALSFLNTVNNKYNFKNVVDRLSEKYIDAGIEYYEKSLARLNILSNCYVSIFERLDLIIQTNDATIRLETLQNKKKQFSTIEGN